MELLRTIIREVVMEAIELPHYMDRVSERLFDPSLISPPLDPKYVAPALQLLKLVNFPIRVNLGVNIFRSRTNFKVLSGDHGTTYEGNNIWVVIRDNELQTVMFLKDGVPPDHVQYKTTIDRVSKAVDKNGYNITIADLDSKPAPKDAKKPSYSMDLPIVNIRGQRWYVNEEKELFIYVKNTNKVMTFNDAFSILPSEELDAILAQLDPALSSTSIS